MANKVPSPQGSSCGFSHEEIKELLAEVNKNRIEELEVETGEFRLRIVGQRAPQQVISPAPIATAPAALPTATAEAPAAAPAASGTASAGAPASTPEEDLSKYKKVTSPMVGTFYRSPAPDAPAFVQVGDRVDENTVLCIIEAMKLMNEIKAETTGVIRQVLVENGQPVEYGQPIYAIEPL